VKAIRERPQLGLARAEAARGHELVAAAGFKEVLPGQFDAYRGHRMP
jgi:hypothetical protein